MDRRALVAALVEWVTAHDVDVLELDCIVYDLKSSEASKINNAGLKAQLDYVGDLLELDRIVHELKGSEASEINDAGLEAQLDYILSCHGDDVELTMRYLETTGITGESND